MNEKRLAAMAGSKQYLVAYTIDGKQPVISTIIGDDPLFYFSPLDSDGAHFGEEGNAFCETCCAITPFHSENVERAFVPDPWDHCIEMICNRCETPIASFYGSNPCEP